MNSISRFVFLVLTMCMASPCCAATEASPQWMLVYVALLPVAAVVKGFGWLFGG